MIWIIATVIFVAISYYFGYIHGVEDERGD